MMCSDIIYENYNVLSPDSILMFRCSKKKFNWYLKKKLATSIDDYTIKLNFIPKGLGHHDKDYGLQIMNNMCVNCGSIKMLNRHHVVPICYRKFFPLEIKSHNFHDILPMCVMCHENYERKADVLKRIIADTYMSPINGETINDGIRKYIRMANTLINGSISNKLRDSIRKKIKKKFNIKRLTNGKIVEISNIKIVKRSHGEIVISKIDSITDFIKMWRNHFIENNDCKYIPSNWAVDYVK